MKQGAISMQLKRCMYDQEFLSRTVTCQFHFKNCAKNQIKNINIKEQVTFKSLCEKLCYTYTYKT